MSPAPNPGRVCLPRDFPGENGRLRSPGVDTAGVHADLAARGEGLRIVDIDPGHAATYLERSTPARKGNCYDNAPTESLWGTIKQELIFQRRFRTRSEAMMAIREYIEVFYNRIRRHSAIGNMAPSIFAESYYYQRRSA